MHDNKLGESGTDTQSPDRASCRYLVYDSDVTPLMLYILFVMSSHSFAVFSLFVYPCAAAAPIYGVALLFVVMKFTVIPISSTYPICDVTFPLSV